MTIFTDLSVIRAILDLFEVNYFVIHFGHKQVLEASNDDHGVILVFVRGEILDEAWSFDCDRSTETESFFNPLDLSDLTRLPGSG